MKRLVLILVLLGASLHAEQTSFTEYAQVVSSTPSYENVITRVPHQECYDEQVPVTYYDGGYRNDSGAAIVGGVIGGVLGHQIGGGHGKDAATIGGAILGTFVGQNAAQANQRVYQSSNYETRRRCTTKYTERTERKFMGYKNVAYYKGHKIVKYSDRALSSIPVTVTISY